MKKVIAATALLVALVASGAAQATVGGGKWMTLAEAKRTLRSGVTHATVCINYNYCGPTRDGSSNSYTVQLYVMRASVRPQGAMLPYKGRRYYQSFYVKAYCASDRLTGTVYHGAFVWGFWGMTGCSPASACGPYHDPVWDSLGNARVSPGCVG